MPIKNITFHGKWADNSPNYGYDTNTINILKSDNGLNKIKRIWSKTEQNYNLHFVRSKRTETELLQNETNPNQLKAIADFVIQPDPDAISIVYLNNESRGDDANMLTGWMLAHRMLHAISGGLMRYTKDVFTTFHEVLENYGLNGHDYNSFGNCTLAIRLSNAVGTMKSARKNLIPRFWEFVHEINTQWLITKSIKFNPLPEKLGNYKNNNLDEDNEQLDVLKRTHGNFLKQYFNTLKGRLFCM
jgi:hypothetical protein